MTAKEMKKIRTSWIRRRFLVILNSWKFEQKRRGQKATDKMFAELLGVARSAVVKYKAGTAIPSDKTLIRITELFGLSEDFFDPAAALELIRDKIDLFLSYNQEETLGLTAEEVNEMERNYFANEAEETDEVNSAE